MKKSMAVTMFLLPDRVLWMFLKLFVGLFHLIFGPGFFFAELDCLCFAEAPVVSCKSLNFCKKWGMILLLMPHSNKVLIGIIKVECTHVPGRFLGTANLQA